MAVNLGAQGDTLEAVCDDFWRWLMKEFPEFSTISCEHRYDDCLETYTLNALEDRQIAATKYSERLRALDQSQFNSNDQLNFKLLSTAINDYFLSGYRWCSYVSVNPINYLDGVAINKMATFLELPDQSMTSYVNIVSRLKKYPEQIQQQMQLMRLGISSGLTNHAVSMARIIPNINKWVTAPLESSDFYYPFADLLDKAPDIDGAEKARIREEALSAIEQINDALRSLSIMIEEEYIPKTRPLYGISSLPHGSEFYHACLKWHTTTELTAREISDLGLAEVQRIQGNLDKVMKDENFSGSLEEFQAMITNMPDFYHKSKEAILEHYQQLVDKISTRLGSVLNEDMIPTVPCRVEEMKTDGPGGFYSPPHREGDPAKFKINVHNLSQGAAFYMLATILHEVSPGHHCQCTFQQITSHLPLFRKYVNFTNYYRVPFHFPFYTAYSEGWALYAEYLGEEMGLYETVYDRYGRYMSEMLRAVRLVVDPGIHAFNWSRQEAIDYMSDRVLLSKERIEGEVDRIVTWPGQACSYKVGELKILELRRRAESAFNHQGGPHFDVKEFHSQVLRLGPVPLAVLEQQIDSWIASKTSDNCPL